MSFLTVVSERTDASEFTEASELPLQSVSTVDNATAEDSPKPLQSRHFWDATICGTLRRVLRENDYLWARYFRRGDRFFHGVYIAKDDGFSEVARGTLWYPMRYFWAAVPVLWLGVNCFYMLTSTGFIELDSIHLVDIDTRRSFFLTGSIATSVFDLFNIEVKLKPQHWLIYVEVCLWVYNLLRGLFALILLGCGTSQLRWHACVSFFWIIVPQLGTLSAMTFLYYVTPQVLASALDREITMTHARFKRRSISFFVHMLGFLISRLFLGIVGLDAFFMKFRNTALYVEPRIIDQVGEAHAIVHVLLFVNQLLGVVQVKWMVQLRLFQFIFGGEDSILSDVADAKRRGWLALLAKEMYSVFPFHRFLAIMLSFCDDDFQLLVLDETAHELDPSHRFVMTTVSSVRDDVLDEDGQALAFRRSSLRRSHIEDILSDSKRSIT